MKLDATAYFQCAKDDVKVLSNTLEPDILQKKYVSAQEIWPECIRYVNYVTALLAQCFLHKNTIYYFQYQKKKMKFLIFIVYCFKTNNFFLVNSSNLMDTIKTIIELIELQLNSTVNS